MSTALALDDPTVDLVTLKKFSESTGVTRKAVYQKINKGVWQEGREYRRDPQGLIWISKSGYQEWVKHGYIQPASKSEATPSKSNLRSKVKLRIATKPSLGQPRQLT